MASHELRFLQIQASMEQGQLLPGAKMMDFLTSLEYVSTISATGDYPEYILGLRYQDEDAMTTAERLYTLLIEKGLV